MIYRLTIWSFDDIAHQIPRATSSDKGSLETIPAGRFDFWVTPALRPGNQQLNLPATKMLLGASTFTARQVPLLRGRVVVTARDHGGQLVSLSEEEIS